MSMVVMHGGTAVSRRGTRFGDERGGDPRLHQRAQLDSAICATDRAALRCGARTSDPTARIFRRWRARVSRTRANADAHRRSGTIFDVAPVARRVCRGSRHTGAPLIDTTSCAFSDECRCLTPERERRASRQLRGPGRRRDRGRSMQSHCALRMIRRRAQLATGQPPADSRFRRPTPASSRSRWRPFATSVGIGASCHGVGLLAPALLLHQERGHEVRADRGLRKGRKRGVSRRPRQAGAEAAPFRPKRE